MTKLRKNHKFLNVGTHVNEICKPLQHLNAHMFTYMKNFTDGTQVYLSSHPQWIEDYYALKLHDSSYFEGDPSKYESGFKWWPEASDLPVFTHGRDNYNSHYGITYCQQVADGCEFFFFSSGQENKAAMEVYLNNLDLLENFSVYFKESAATILRQCDRSRIHRQNNHHVDTAADLNMRRELFMRAIGGNNRNFDTFLMQFEKLTVRERECLDYVLSASSTSEVALAMNVSIRTAETHIQRIKSKLVCKTKNELIKKLLLHAERKTSR